MSNWLYRAVAYRMVGLHNPVGDSLWPEVTVFIEAPQPDTASAAAQLLRALSAAWGCATTDIDFYNLWSEGELLRNSGLPHLAGDARLLQNGWFHGPLFCDVARTVLLVRPPTMQRLVRAQGMAADLAITHATGHWGRHLPGGRRASDRAVSA